MMQDAVGWSENTLWTKFLSKVTYSEMWTISNFKNNLFLQIVMLFIHTKQYEHMQLQFLTLRHIKNVLHVKGFAFAVIVTLTFIPSSRPQIVLEDLHDTVSFSYWLFSFFPKAIVIYHRLKNATFYTSIHLYIYTVLYISLCRCCQNVQICIF